MLDLKTDCCRFPDSVFMLGTRYEYLSEWVREADAKRHLSLRNIVDATPPVWVRLGPFALGRRMVSNGEYLRFLEHAEAGGDGARRLYDQAMLWEHVWSRMNLCLSVALVPFEEAPGQITQFEEDYANASGFVDAYLLSLAFEVRRVLMAARAGGGAAAEPDSRSQLLTRDMAGDSRRMAAPKDMIVRRVFAAAKYVLRQSVGADAETVLNDRDRELFEAYSEPGQVVAEIQGLVGDLRKAYAQRIDQRYRAQFKSGKFVIEPIQFLERLAAGARRLPDLGALLPLSQVLYPRYWPAPRPQETAGAFARQTVPWEEQPVFGLTLYEAAAYAAWLSHASGLDVTLPNEAQCERADSWPAQPAPERDGALVLDPALKAIFPWQEHNPKDFHAYFGREGETFEHTYYPNRKKYETLVAETGRPVDDQPALEMAQGFGWSWTIDRYSDDERKYHRFTDPDYPEYRDPAGRPFSLRGAEGQAVKVYDYQTNTNLKFWNFVLKGSPGVVGGPGLTIRRYAAFPLRAYPNVGFRIAVRETQ